jgi:hypothetical protein
VGKLIEVDFTRPRKGAVITPEALLGWEPECKWFPDSEWSGSAKEVRRARDARVGIAADIALRYTQHIAFWEVNGFEPIELIEVFLEIQERSQKLLSVLDAKWWLEHAYHAHEGLPSAPCADEALRNILKHEPKR